MPQSFYVCTDHFKSQLTLNDSDEILPQKDRGEPCPKAEDQNPYHLCLCCASLHVDLTRLFLPVANAAYYLSFLLFILTIAFQLIYFLIKKKQNKSLSCSALKWWC